ncbi:hypothetical protein NPIL_181691 [Nephila pilipes]|uniref:Uncharacterized protein n=1 Tax=Nephila pilipes TaxID=299642 RepID=A0A8X6PIR4_NEPPI|nr:hypothetical protein NPIL_181691 [Nephila pilipes]
MEEEAAVVGIREPRKLDEVLEAPLPIAGVSSSCVSILEVAGVLEKHAISILKQTYEFEIGLVDAGEMASEIDADRNFEKSSSSMKNAI